MRRRQSDALPQYTRESSAAQSPLFPRRYAYYLVLALFACWWFFSPSSSSTRSRNNALPQPIWSHYAYSLYATDSATLCHAVLLFEALARLGSRADRVLFYPESWDTLVSSARDRDSQLLVLARDGYGVKLHPVPLLRVGGRAKDEWTSTWDKSVTKFMAFGLGYYDRVIALDSDITLLQHLDDLFLLPPTPMAMPRAYWADSKPWPLTSMLMVLTPDVAELERFKQTLGRGGEDELVSAHRFDMELVNERFEDSALVLPHRPYALLSGEFRRAQNDHAAYLGNSFEEWDADKAYKEAKLVHFSDWPLPKPWIMWPTDGLAEMQPACGGSHTETCAERRIWKHLYEDFRSRRRDICKLLSVPAPDWYEIKHGKRPGNATDGTEHAAPPAEHGHGHGHEVLGESNP